MTNIAIRKDLNTTIGELAGLRDMIFSTQKFAEEMIRINEMTITLLAFSAYNDDQLNENVVDISRICNGIRNYTDITLLQLTITSAIT